MRTQRDAGFTLIELMIVVAIIAVLVAVAAPAYQRYRMNGNETSALVSMKAIADAQAAYASGCGGGGYAVSMEDLAKAPVGGGTGYLRADLAEAVDADHAKSGYYFTVTDGPDSKRVVDKARTCNQSANDPKTGYFATGQPAAVGSTGTLYFSVDETTLIRQGTGPLADSKSGSAVR